MIIVVLISSPGLSLSQITICLLINRPHPDNSDICIKQGRCKLTIIGLSELKVLRRVYLVVEGGGGLGGGIRVGGDLNEMIK